MMYSKERLFTGGGGGKRHDGPVLYRRNFSVRWGNFLSIVKIKFSEKNPKLSTSKIQKPGGVVVNAPFPPDDAHDLKASSPSLNSIYVDLFNFRVKSFCANVSAALIRHLLVLMQMPCSAQSVNMI
jgi:hypothetical protein